MNSQFIWSVSFGLSLFIGWCPDVALARQQSINGNISEARVALSDGVQAYRAGQIDVAIQDFKKAKDLDHSLVNASLYLATAYSAQFVPGDTSGDNMQNGQLALEEFKEILKQHPDNEQARTMLDQLGR